MFYEIGQLANPAAWQRDDSLAKMMGNLLVRTVDSILRSVLWDLRGIRMNSAQSANWAAIDRRWRAMLSLRQDPVRLLRENGLAVHQLSQDALAFRERILAIPPNPYGAGQ